MINFEFGANFLKILWVFLWCPQVRQELDSGATVVQPTPYGNMPVARRFAEESTEVEVDTSKVRRT